MKFIETKIPGAFLIEIEELRDERGFFARAFCQQEFERLGLKSSIVQSNISGNPAKGTLRGLHFQKHPFEEVKIVRCTRGAIFDVLVDLRPGSETLGQWDGYELTAENHRMLYIPERFAHGFQTLEPDTEVMYLVTQFYSREHASGLPHDDPAFDISWPLPVSAISDADANWERYSASPFGATT